MLTKIKALADEAIALQNKNRMDEVLREISKMLTPKYNDNDLEPMAFGLNYVPQETEDEVNPEHKADIAEEKPRKGVKNAK